MRKYLLLLCALLSAMAMEAANYTVKVGSTLTLKCTASAPRGTITHAVFEIANAEDSKYLGMTGYDTKAQTATFAGLQPKSGIKVRVTYYYSYRGTYSDRMEIGHGTYTESVTVTGGGTPTGIKISPSSVRMRVGETITAKVVLTPSNAAADYEVGWIETLSSPPSYFDWSFKNGVFTVTAKKAGTLYLAAQVSEKLVATCSITANTRATTTTEPTSISLTPVEKPLKVGESLKMEYSILPMGASARLAWMSSDETVAEVSATGKVTAKKEGNASITVTTDNGFSSTADITVAAKAQSISLPQSATAVLGFAYQLKPSVSPAGADADCTWTSSDTSVASVSATGRVTGHNDGNAKITAKCGDLSAATDITIVRPSAIDAANASARVAEIDATANRTLLNIK